MKWMQRFVVLVLALVWMGVAAAGGQAETAYTVKSKDLKAVAGKVEANPALAEAACIQVTPASAKANSLTYACAKPNEKTDAAFRGVLGGGDSLSAKTVTCPANCVMTYCPYPMLNCCNVYTHQPCR